MSIERKIKFHYVMYILFFILMTTFFILGVITSKNTSNSFNGSCNLKLSSIAGYLKLLSVNETQTIFNIALHSFGLAITAYILSFLSSGILGIIPLCSSFLIGGITFCTLPKNLNNISFIALELIGMVLAIFSGIIFRQKQKYGCWSMRKILVYSSILTVSLFLIYIIASCIENKLLQALWG